MKTSSLMKNLSLALAASSLLISCGGGGGKSQKIPGGRNNFSIELDQILSPVDGETVDCLQVAVQIRVPYGNLCQNPDEIRDSVHIIHKDEEQPVELGVVYKKKEMDDGCVLEVSSKQWLLPEEEYMVSTRLDSSGSVILSGSETIRFFTPSYDENRSCNNAMKIVSPDSNWRKTHLLEQGKIGHDGKRRFNKDEFGEVFYDLISEFGLALLGLSTLGERTPIVIPFNYQPSSFFFENHILVKSIGVENIAAYLSGDYESAGFQDVILEDCDTANGSCFEILQNSNNGQWNLVIHPDNQGWRNGVIYFFVVLETFSSVTGKYMNATWLRPEAR